MIDPASRTPTSALVWIPPESIWEPIQAIRARYDRHFKRWMPHLTLLYPFRPRAEFEAVADALASIDSPPIDCTLESFRFFRHYEWSHTSWLDPEPAADWKRLPAALLARFPECTDSSKYENGFSPHLSVGQARSAELAGTLQQTWTPLAWKVKELALVARNDREPFEVVKTIALPE